MLRDHCNFVRVKTQIQGMQDPTAAWNAEKGFEMFGVVPHHGGDTVTTLHSKFRQRTGKPPGPGMEFAVAGASDGLVRLLRNDFDARKDSSGALQNRGQRQRKGHHSTAHKPPKGRDEGWRILPLKQDQLYRRHVRGNRQTPAFFRQTAGRSRYWKLGIKFPITAALIRLDMPAHKSG